MTDYTVIPIKKKPRPTSLIEMERQMPGFAWALLLPHFEEARATLPAAVQAMLGTEAPDAIAGELLKLQTSDPAAWSRLPVDLQQIIQAYRQVPVMAGRRRRKE